MSLQTPLAAEIPEETRRLVEPLLPAESVYRLVGDDIAPISILLLGLDRVQPTVAIQTRIARSAGFDNPARALRRDFRAILRIAGPSNDYLTVLGVCAIISNSGTKIITCADIDESSLSGALPARKPVDAPVVSTFTERNRR